MYVGEKFAYSRQTQKTKNVPRAVRKCIYVYFVYDYGFAYIICRVYPTHDANIFFSSQQQLFSLQNRE